METKKHYYWIDLVRFISALLVVLAHCRGALFVEYRLLPDFQKNIYTQLLFFLTRLGEESVLVFFVLSGFLVGGKALQRILHNEVDFRSYLIDRLVRIFLPLAASSLMVILIDLIVGTSVPFSDILGSFFGLQGIVTQSAHNPPLWSLSYEVWFYVLIGCVMVITRSNGRSPLLAYVALALCFYVFLALKTLYLFILLLGAFSFLLPRSPLSRRRGMIYGCVCMLIFSFFLLQTTSNSRSFSISYFSFINREMASIFLALITSLLIHYIIDAKPESGIGIKIELLSSKLSDFSYTLYLTHYPLIALLSHIGFRKSSEIGFLSVFYYLLAVFISLSSAYVIYLVSEKKTSTVKNFIKGKIKRNEKNPSTRSEV